MIGPLLVYGPWVVFVVALAALLATKGRWFPKTEWGLIAAGAVWIFLIQGDSILLGPRARLEWGDGETLFIGYFPYLASVGDSLFLADLIGGTDRFALGRIGGAIVSLRLLLLEVLPLWLVIVLLRVVTSATALASVYLFARRRFDCPPIFAFALGALVAAGFDVNATMTFLYAISIAALPLILYFLVTLDGRAGPWLGFLVFTIIYVSLADPFYWLPLTWLAAFLLITWHRPKSYVGFGAGLVVLSAFWAANYSEAIFAVFQFAPHSGRPSDLLAGPFGERLLHHARWLLSLKLQYNQGGWPYIFPVAFALFAAWRTRSRTTLFAALTALLVGFAAPFLIAIPWSKLGLDFLDSYRWYLEYGAFPLAMLAAAQAGAALYARKPPSPGEKPLRIVAVPAAICIAIGLAMLTSFKINMVAHMATLGNLTLLEDIPNLRKHEWYSGESRVVGLPTRYPPNLSPSYGLASFDGGATFVPNTLVTYWRKLVMRRGLTVTPWAPGFPTLAEYNGCCEPYPIEQDVSLDMLRVANVGYIISYRALTSPRLHQVSGPKPPVHERMRARILGPAKPVRVYAIADPMPRAYGARTLEVLPDDANSDAFFATISERAPGRAAVLHQTVADALTNQPWSSGEEPRLRAVEDGFYIDLPADAEGLVLANLPPLPWWHATTEDGSVLATGPANLNQLAIAVPSGHRTIRLRYERPTLFW